MSLEIAKKLIECELTISKLYSTSAEHFPELSDFWNGLAQEEIGHANTIEDLLSQVDGRMLKLNKKRFNIRPLEISIEHAENIISRIEFGELDLIGVLSLALDIEQSVIESKYYEIFEGGSREYSDRLKQVRNESRGHSMLISDMKQKALAGEI
ncbi:MAG: hypothetical protein KAH14_03120 [Clostridiales bacterium]|nr:hypothetical protein [Clostridiales bacterium]